MLIVIPLLFSDCQDDSPEPLDYCELSVTIECTLGLGTISVYNSERDEFVTLITILDDVGNVSISADPWGNRWLAGESYIFRQEFLGIDSIFRTHIDTLECPLGGINYRRPNPMNLLLGGYGSTSECGYRGE